MLEEENNNQLLGDGSDDGNDGLQKIYKRSPQDHNPKF